MGSGGGGGDESENRDRGIRKYNLTPIIISKYNIRYFYPLFVQVLTSIIFMVYA